MCVLCMGKKTLKVLICKIFETYMFIIMCSHSLSQIEVVVKELVNNCENEVSILSLNNL
jgi:hypothetical protein